MLEKDVAKSNWANILVVDDHEENRVALRAILSSADYRIVEAGSGHEALRRLLEDEFAVLLLDVVMPGMSGFELATVVKERLNTAAVPIVFLTGEASDVSLVYRGYGVGAVDYLIKPLVPEMVRAKVAVFVDLYRQRKRIEEQSTRLIESERKTTELRIVELRLAEEKRRCDEAEETIRSRDEFVSIASHELKTPLSSLQLQIELLVRPPRRMAQVPALAPQVRDKLEKALAQVERLTHLVSELLDVSRIAVGQLQLAVESFDLAAIAADVVARFKDSAASARVEIVLRAEQGVVGSWDRLRMEQVLTNLLGNALKFGDSKPIEIAVSKEGEAARLVVRDHGVGIALEDLERIFRRYERATSVRHYGGLGLGLYIVREIVEAHGGKIHANSRPGAGSTFVVDVPLNSPPEKRDDE
jgi:signal transduction histidine kinase